MNAFDFAGLAAAFLAWASYLPVSKSPRLRKNMWPTIALMGLALLIVVARAATRPAGEPRLGPLDLSALALALLFVPVYFLALRVPRAGGRPQPGQVFPAVTFIGDEAQTISSAELVQRGPMLFVFFRGFW
jgi:hypothetical protein